MYILHKQLEWRWREERLLLSPKLIYGPLSVLNFECGSTTNRNFWCSSREEHLESSRDSGPLWLLHILGCYFSVSSTLTHGYSKCIFRVWAAFVLAFFFFYFEGHVDCIHSSDIYMASPMWRTKKCDIGGKHTTSIMRKHLTKSYFEGGNHFLFCNGIPLNLWCAYCAGLGDLNEYIAFYKVFPYLRVVFGTLLHLLFSLYGWRVFDTLCSRRFYFTFSQLPRCERWKQAKLTTRALVKLIGHLWIGSKWLRKHWWKVRSITFGSDNPYHQALFSTSCSCTRCISSLRTAYLLNASLCLYVTVLAIDMVTTMS